MFNKKINIGLFICIMSSSVFIVSACTEKKYNNHQVANQPLDAPAKINVIKRAEYIIVLKKGTNITTALKSLKIKDIQLIKNLKKDRYLVSVENDPGINSLKENIINSKYIKHIQANFIYTTQ